MDSPMDKIRAATSAVCKTTSGYCHLENHTNVEATSPTAALTPTRRRRVVSRRLR